MSSYKVGEVRPSQLLWTYGPGALIDLPNISVLTMGLDRWNADVCTPVEEARLLAAVQRILGPQVKRLRMPPFVREDGIDSFSAEGKLGVPVQPFPRWLRCVKCGLLAEYDSGLFDIKENSHRPEQTHFVHTNCDKGSKNADAVPARFLLACRNGHLDDFPWHWFVHGGYSDCKETLRFFERGASLQTENLWVKCDACGTARSLVHAFGDEAVANLPACRGRHPHLTSYEKCDEEARTILLGATNGWFPINVSVLAIPLAGYTLSQLITDGWAYFSSVQNIEQLEGLLIAVKGGALLPGIDKYKTQDIWESLQEHKVGKSATIISDGDIKTPEWEVLTSENPPANWPHFLSRKTSVPKAYKNYFSKVLLLERLREVNALIGYTRIETAEETSDSSERPPMAALSRNKPDWIPANEVHGEGIFIQFNENAVHEWEKQSAVLKRNELLFAGHEGWRRMRHLEPKDGYPGIRYTMLHTFVHILIRELALECGYNAASIRERIYAKKDSTVSMAGILLYTAAADSDGTLGGLVELGKPENLGRLITQALNRATVCASDPLCSDHNPKDDRSLHLAACHSCAFVSETSCEQGNRYLDRALIVNTFESNDAAFFSVEE
ncbi:hypothetical protein AGMMS50212_10280 [Spirochaetia bacterium]|nr:hypothetical protein AGMMS50212_10280 [Spirochaetia bacterium]